MYMHMWGGSSWTDASSSVVSSLLLASSPGEEELSLMHASHMHASHMHASHMHASSSLSQERAHDASLVLRRGAGTGGEQRRRDWRSKVVEEPAPPGAAPKVLLTSGASWLGPSGVEPRALKTCEALPRGSCPHGGSPSGEA